MRIGITAGDINGVGLEVVIKALADKRISEQCTPVIYANSKVLVYHKNIVEKNNFNFQSIKNANCLLYTSDAADE